MSLLLLLLLLTLLTLILIHHLNCSKGLGSLTVCCEFCEIFKNTFFTEHVRVTALALPLLYFWIEYALYYHYWFYIKMFWQTQRSSKKVFDQDGGYLLWNTGDGVTFQFFGDNGLFHKGFFQKFFQYLRYFSSSGGGCCLGNGIKKLEQYSRAEQYS